jgi:hypothetical protein
MGFVFLHYPEYGSEPNFGPFFDSLFNSAKYAEAAADAYKNPRKNENEYGNEYDEEEEDPLKDEGYSTFGKSAATKNNKKKSKISDGRSGCIKG